MIIKNQFFSVIMLFIYLFLFISTFLSNISAEKDNPTPIVIWHGLGDSSYGMLSWKALLERHIPNVHVLLVKTGKTKQKEIDDTFFLNANKQVKMICATLKNDTRLNNGYHGVGWSQGALLMRAIAQRCPNPPMLNYISLGGPQQGVFGIPKCYGKWYCKVIRALFDEGVYTKFVQSIYVTAQYWHDPLQEEIYKRKSTFLADINNEWKMNRIYKESFMNLANVVLLKFLKDEIVIPRESEWFGFYKPGHAKDIQAYNDTRLFSKDRIGLKQLYNTGKVHFLESNGYHMQISEEDFLQKIIKPFLIN